MIKTGEIIAGQQVVGIEDDKGIQNQLTNDKIEGILTREGGKDKIAMEQDIRRAHALIAERIKRLNQLNEGIKNPGWEQLVLDSLLDILGIEKNEETRYAAYGRIATLREDGLLNYIDKKGITEEQKDEIRALAFAFVQRYHDTLHLELIETLERDNLFTPFYRKLIAGVHHIGGTFNTFHTAWNRKLINGVNRELESRFGGLESVMKYLSENDLFDTGHGGELADRSYSILERDGEGYKKLAYIDALPEEVGGITRELGILRDTLMTEEDEVYGQKDAYIQYLEALIDAFSEKDTDSLVRRWARVDELWMDIKTPFQIVHPLESYKDPNRNAVSPELELRLKDSDLFDSTVQEDVRNMFQSLAIEMSISNDSPIKMFSLQGLDKVQLYISNPMMYYGSRLGGLPSAQVVPNDVEVTKTHGKKIFSFPEDVLSYYRSRPLMKIETLTLSDDIRAQRKNLILGPDAGFYALYDIETIGHEFGHTLWLDSDTEITMNRTGNFQNIEEWKATVGGLMAFFQNPKEESKKDVVVDLIVRSVRLMIRMKQGDVLPYYAEGLIHLKILFDSGMISLDNDGKVEMNYSEATFDALSTMYKEHYKRLIQTYVEKRDASEFLSEYTIEQGRFLLPKDEKIRAFVEGYYKLYEEIGNVVESE